MKNFIFCAVVMKRISTEILLFKSLQSKNATTKAEGRKICFAFDSIHLESF